MARFVNIPPGGIATISHHDGEEIVLDAGARVNIDHVDAAQIAANGNLELFLTNRRAIVITFPDGHVDGNAATWLRAIQ